MPQVQLLKKKKKKKKKEENKKKKKVRAGKIIETKPLLDP